jgi:hypothetical protein
MQISKLIAGTLLDLCGAIAQSMPHAGIVAEQGWRNPGSLRIWVPVKEPNQTTRRLPP